MNIAKNHWVTFKCTVIDFITLTGAVTIAIWNILQHFGNNLTAFYFN